MELSLGKRIRIWGLRLLEFGLVQGIVQLAMAFAGILIVRSLSKPEYAFYAISNSMQTAGNLLADLGIGIGVRSIGGRVWNDPHQFGALLRTVLSLRRRLCIVSLSVCLPFTAWMLARNGASVWLQVGLCLTIAFSIIPLLGITAWGTSAQLHGEYRRIQKLDLSGALLRLALVASLTATKITALSAALVTVIGNTFQAIFLRRWAGEKMSLDSPESPEHRRELLRLARKWTPNVIFFCVQGQVTLFILTLVGSTVGIADITALGRLAALFTVFSTTFSNVLAPRFARCQDSRRLPRLYALLAVGTVVILLPLVLLIWLFPAQFVWLLGRQYRGLESECIWVVIAGCVTQVGGVMWTLNSSKAWITVQSFAFIPMIVCTQIVAAFVLNLRQFHGVLIFNLLTACAPLPVYVLDALLGMNASLRVRPETS